MSVSLLKTVGEIAGLGGLALGVFMLVFRDILRQKLLSAVGPAQSYRIIRQMIWATWSLALMGLILYSLGGLQLTFGANSPITVRN
jgi:hypothetical protein